jgi:hypothetical protein
MMLLMCSVKLSKAENRTAGGGNRELFNMHEILVIQDKQAAEMCRKHRACVNNG